MFIAKLIVDVGTVSSFVFFYFFPRTSRIHSFVCYNLHSSREIPKAQATYTDIVANAQIGR